MPRKDRHRPALTRAVRVFAHAFRVAFMLAVLTLPVAVQAQDTQDLERANQALFMAVDRNDLPGVRAAIQAGADIEASGYSSMPAVDLAIDRGYFDIAHYLISVRNARASGDEAPAPTPSPEELAEAAKQAPMDAPAPTPAPTQEPAPQPPAPLAPTPQAPKQVKDSPFDAPRAAGDLPVITQAPPLAEVAEASPATEVAEAADSPDTPVLPEKKSAAKTFITTFFNFFDKPNTTGVVRRQRDDTTGADDAVTETELSKQLQEIEALQGNEPIKGPAVPISPEELAKQLPPAPEVPEGAPATDGEALDTPQLPPYALERKTPERTITAPPASGEDPFGDIEIAEATPADDVPTAPANVEQAPPSLDQQFEDVLVGDLPFGGGVDPDILALIGEGPAPSAAPDDPFASTDSAEQDPFAAPGKESDVATADPFAQPGDPFAAPTGDGAGSSDELDGLFESTTNDGWDVKKVEGGAGDGPVVAVLTEIVPTGEALDGVELSLGLDTNIGKEVGDDRMLMMKEETIHKPCLYKGGPDTMFCIDQVSWPFDLEDDFQVDTIMYQGTRAVGRYDAGRATHFHALFNVGGFERVIGFFIERYGQPVKKVDRAIAPLAAPRTDNPTYIWQSREPGTDTVTTLEVRKFDDVRDSFPDTRRGVILLYRSHAGEIFPLLSQLELMVLKPEGVADLAPKTAETVW